MGTVLTVKTFFGTVTEFLLFRRRFRVVGLDLIMEHRDKHALPVATGMSRGP